MRSGRPGHPVSVILAAGVGLHFDTHGRATRPVKAPFGKTRWPVLAKYRQHGSCAFSHPLCRSAVTTSATRPKAQILSMVLSSGVTVLFPPRPVPGSPPVLSPSRTRATSRRTARSLAAVARTAERTAPPFWRLRVTRGSPGNPCDVGNSAWPSAALRYFHHRAALSRWDAAPSRPPRGTRGELGALSRAPLFCDAWRRIRSK